MTDSGTDVILSLDAGREILFRGLSVADFSAATTDWLPGMIM